VKPRRFPTRTALLALVSTAVATGGVLALPAAMPSAGAAGALSITTSPGLKPAFNPAVSDYTVRCGASPTRGTTVTVAVHAPAGVKVSVAGGAPRTGSFTAKVTRAWSQSFPFVVAKGAGKLAVYTARCLPTDAPGFGVLKSGKSTAAFYLMSAHGTTSNGPVLGGYSLHYVDVVDARGVPMWWRKTGSVVGETKVLRNGHLAWLPSALALEERALDGRLVAKVNVPDGFAPDQHDFEQLPNGNWLLVAYPPVTGVDLTAIGGAANTCILDSELEEVTPAGKRVWSWYASQHIPVTDLMPNVRAAVSNSTCAVPKDLWHLNSEQVVGGDIVLSLRRNSAVYRINRSTGAVKWKLGGTASPQQLTIGGDPHSGFIGEHDARMWGDGTVSVFDNGDDGNNAPARRRSRVVRYQINTASRTARMVEQIVDPKVSNPLGAFCCGSARRLAGGHWAIGYGGQGVNTEVTSSGKRVLSFNYNDHSLNVNRPAPALFSYRMDPVTGHAFTRAKLRAGMDAMHPVNDTTPPVVTLVASTCGNRSCRATYDVFDNVGLPKQMCRAQTIVTACRIVVTVSNGAPVTTPPGRICDARGNCVAPAAAGRADRTATTRARVRS
jgi:hypothetical protein